jgi:transketolase N-terminal domain/subunit
MDMLESLKTGNSPDGRLHQYTDFTAAVFNKVDRRSSGSLDIGLRVSIGVALGR